MDQNQKPNVNPYSANNTTYTTNQAYQQPPQPQYRPPVQGPVDPNTYTGDPRFKPLGAWAYYGYSLLFSIPLVGFIMLIVYSFNDDNINRRNYARSFWCAALIGVVIGTVVTVLIFALGISLGNSGVLNDLFRNFR